MPPHHAKGGEHAGACGPNRAAILWGWPSCVSDSPRAKHGTQVWRQSPAHDPAPAMGARQKKERIVKPVRRPGHMPELKSRLRFCPACKSLLSSIGFFARGHAFAQAMHILAVYEVCVFSVAAILAAHARPAHRGPAHP